MLPESILKTQREDLYLKENQKVVPLTSESARMLGAFEKGFKRRDKTW